MLILLFLLQPLSRRLKNNLDKFSIYLVEHNSPLEIVNSITRNPCKNMSACHAEYTFPLVYFCKEYVEY